MYLSIYLSIMVANSLRYIGSHGKFSECLTEKDVEEKSCDLIDILFRYLPERLRKTKNLVIGLQLIDDIPNLNYISFAFLRNGSVKPRWTVAIDCDGVHYLRYKGKGHPRIDHEGLEGE
jgi:hypothetical protein